MSRLTPEDYVNGTSPGRIARLLQDAGAGSGTWEVSRIVESV